jgi:hypothetical protein
MHVLVFSIENSLFYLNILNAGIQLIKFGILLCISSIISMTTVSLTDW